MPPGEYFLNEIACYLGELFRLFDLILRRSSPFLFPSIFLDAHLDTRNKYRALVSHGYKLDHRIVIVVYRGPVLVSYIEIEKDAIPLLSVG